MRHKTAFLFTIITIILVIPFLLSADYAVSHYPLLKDGTTAYAMYVRDETSSFSYSTYYTLDEDLKNYFYYGGNIGNEKHIKSNDEVLVSGTICYDLTDDGSLANQTLLIENASYLKMRLCIELTLGVAFLICLGLSVGGWLSVIHNPKELQDFGHSAMFAALLACAGILLLTFFGVCGGAATLVRLIIYPSHQTGTITSLVDTSEVLSSTSDTYIDQIITVTYDEPYNGEDTFTTAVHGTYAPTYHEGERVLVAAKASSNHNQGVVLQIWRLYYQGISAIIFALCALALVISCYHNSHKPSARLSR